MKLATGEQLIFSGHTEDGGPHTECLAFLLSSLAQQALVGWEPVSQRIACAHSMPRLVRTTLATKTRLEHKD